MKQQMLMKEAKDGKIAMPPKRSGWDIASTTLAWALVVAAVAAVATMWQYGGPTWGVPSTILGCALIWKEGPR